METQTAADRQAEIGRELKAMADKLGGGSLTPILSHLVESAPLGDVDRERLREWLADLSSISRRSQTLSARARSRPAVSRATFYSESSG